MNSDATLAKQDSITTVKITYVTDASPYLKCQTSIFN